MPEEGFIEEKGDLGNRSLVKMIGAQKGQK